MIIAYDSQLEEPLRNQNNCDEEEQRRKVEGGGLANCDTSREENLAT
jgi:hypothetical protein